jgi:hypothetical protein
LEWSEVDGSNAADSDDNYISVAIRVNEKLIDFVIIPTCLDNLTGSRAKSSNLRPTQSAT